MLKGLVSVLLLFVLLPYFSYSQEATSAISSVERIIRLTEELDQNLGLQAKLIESLEASNSEQSKLIQGQLNDLRELEQSLRKQIALSENLGNLIEDQAVYQRQLERKLTFWRIISGALAASLVTVLAINAASN